MEVEARKQKMCSDPKCREDWEELESVCGHKAGEFSYCPFCAEELSVLCSVCHEAVPDPYFRYCPWCGREFQK